MYLQFIDSPLGVVKITADMSGITAVKFIDESAVEKAQPNMLTEHAASQLQAYFAGTLTQFNVPLAAAGSLFQQRVWQQLCKVPFGTTCSYSAIATALVNPKAVRAVGAANGKNPIAIIVPCHRVIGANGTLTGYAGGLDKKAWLLKHEQRQ